MALCGDFQVEQMGGEYKWPYIESLCNSDHCVEISRLCSSPNPLCGSDRGGRDKPVIHWQKGQEKAS